MKVYYTSSAPIAAQNTLDYTVPSVQQYRVDILKPGATVNTVNTMNVSKILGTPFATVDGDPTVLPPTSESFNMKPLRGKSVRLRFAEVRNPGWPTIQGSLWPR